MLPFEFIILVVETWVVWVDWVVVFAVVWVEVCFAVGDVVIAVAVVATNVLKICLFS